MPEKQSLYRRIFRDVCQGYSQCFVNKKEAFVKHLSTNDQVDLEDIYQDYFDQAKDKGVPTEKDMLNLLIEQDQWSKEDEDFIKNQQAFVDGLISNKKNIVLLSRRKDQEDLINTEKEKLVEKVRQKDDMLGATCERYASNKVSDHYIIRSFFKDRKLKKPFFSKSQFEDFSFKEVQNIVAKYNSIFDKFSEENIQYLTLSSFYEVYFSLCENSIHFFGKPICKLSSNQLRLLTYTKIFKNIIENNPDIPDRIKKDPVALLDFANTSEKEKENIQNQLDKDGATTVFGATEEDYKYLGVDEQEVRPVSLHEEAEKKGGSLSMEDLIKLTGQ